MLSVWSLSSVSSPASSPTTSSFSPSYLSFSSVTSTLKPIWPTRSQAKMEPRRNSLRMGVKRPPRKSTETQFWERSRRESHEIRLVWEVIIWGEKRSHSSWTFSRLDATGCFSSRAVYFWVYWGHYTFTSNWKSGIFYLSKYLYLLTFSVIISIILWLMTDIYLYRRDLLKKYKWHSSGFNLSAVIEIFFKRLRTEWTSYGITFARWAPISHQHGTHVKFHVIPNWCSWHWSC